MPGKKRRKKMDQSEFYMGTGSLHSETPAGAKIKYVARKKKFP
jgi:hypothetical protein